MTTIQAEIIRSVLITLFSGQIFNIRYLDDCIRITNTFVHPKLYNELLALHVIRYDNMSPVLRRWVFETCIGLFSENGFPIDQLDHSKPFPKQPSVSIKLSDGDWVRKFVEN